MSSKTDSIVKLIVMSFVCLLFFSVGTFVGKKYSDNQHQLSILEPQKSPHTAKHEEEHGSEHGAPAEREVASTSGHGEATEKKSGAMTDEEIAKLAEEFVADEAAPAVSEHGGHGGQEESATSHGGKNLNSGKAPTAHEPLTQKKVVEHEERLPTALPKEVAQYTVGKFTVQVAAYDNELEAQKVATDLKGKGYSAFYVPAKLQGKTWYRVSVGQFTTQKEAITYRAEFLNSSKMTTAIVQKIVQ